MYIDDFIFLNPIETGGFSTVWKVLYKGHKYALKMISKDKHQSKIKKKYLKMEIKIHKQLDHENIIKLYNSFEDNFFQYILLELGEEDLFNYVIRYEKLEIDEILDITYQIVKALIFLKEKNIIHGDIKQENILISRNRIKLCDFGFASQNFFHYNFVGTPEYMAPELIKQDIYNHKIDVWSLGIVIYNLLYGYTPFFVAKKYTNVLDINMTKHAICEKELEFPNNNYPLFEDLIKKCLEKDQSKRIIIEEVFQHEIFSKYKI